MLGISSLMEHKWVPLVWLSNVGHILPHSLPEFNTEIKKYNILSFKWVSNFDCPLPPFLCLSPVSSAPSRASLEEQEYRKLELFATF